MPNGIRERMRKKFEVDPDSNATKEEREMRKRMRKKFEVDPDSNATKERKEMRKRMRKKFEADSPISREIEKSINERLGRTKPYQPPKLKPKKSKAPKKSVLRKRKRSRGV